MGLESNRLNSGGNIQSDWLVLRESTHPAAAATPGSTRSGGSLLAGALRDRSSPAADKALHVPTALGALLNRGIAHLLPFLKMAGALFAQIFVGWHGTFLPSHFSERIRPSEGHRQLPTEAAALSLIRHIEDTRAAPGKPPVD